MPLTLQLHLAPLQPCAPRSGADFRHVTGVRSLIYNSLRRAAPALAEQLHADTRPKPFAVAPLSWSGDQSVVELAVLQDMLAPMLLEGLAARGEVLRLGREQYRLTQVVAGEQVTIDELREEPEPPATRWRVEFMTPTVHHETLRITGDTPTKLRKSLPVPDPVLAVTSWYHKWNCLMDRLAREPIPASFLHCLSQLTLTEFAGWTDMIALDRAHFEIGFVGLAVYTVLGAEALSPETHRALRTLARFANYCSTGAETMRGMGRTRVSPQWSAISPSREPAARPRHACGSRPLSSVFVEGDPLTQRELANIAGGAE